MKYYLGIDVGSTRTKIVILNDAKDIAACNVVRNSYDIVKTIEEAIHETIKKSNISSREIYKIVATGYGKKMCYCSDQYVSEISCNCKGVHYYFPLKSKIIDIGGHDNKIINIDRHGNLINFKINQKCASGTGVYLEEVANYLNISLSKMNKICKQAEEVIEISSYCAVFSKTEIMAKICNGKKIENIIYGVFSSIVKRLQTIDILDGMIIFTGGVIEHNPILQKIIKKELNKEIFIPPNPQLIPALGAALYASK